MSEFDPRREPVRFAPALATLTLTLCGAAMIMGSRAEAVTAPKAKPAEAVKAQAKTKTGALKAAVAKTDKADAKTSGAKPDPVKVASKGAKAEAAKLEPKKTAGAEAAKAKDGKTVAAAKPEPGYGKPTLIKVKLRKGETLEAALRRAEVSAEDAVKTAKLVETALGAAPQAGQLFQVEVAPRDGRVGSGRVHKLTLKPAADAEPLIVARGEGGKLATEKRLETKLAKADMKSKGDKAEEVDDEDASAKPERVKLVSGEVRGSLYGSARKAGVAGGQIGEIVKVFGAKLDLERDLKAGDKFKVVYDDSGKLLFAQIKSVRFHRFARKDGEALWLDENGRSLKGGGGLLRTPVDGARMSSSFGMRRHPIFGYHRMHQGIDFAAASGTPILAAGDGVVTKVGRWGGYGNWLQIKHSGGYESGYAHLSRYAGGLKVGDKVKQGELVAYVGSTGASTGPHLHHEIWLNGKRVDPKGAKVPQGFALDGKELVAFKAQCKRVDAVVKGKTELASKKTKAKVAALPAKPNAA